MKTTSRFRLRRWWRSLRPSRRLLVLLFLFSLIPASGLFADRLARDPTMPDLAELLAGAEASEGGSELVLCVDGPEFMAALSRDLAAARQRVFVQTLSFEADPAGFALARGLLDSPATDRRLLIDDYSRVVVSDKLVGAPNRLFDAALLHEAEQTRSLITQLRAHGVDVRYGRRLGLDAAGRQARDHKKLVVVDDRVAYTGGINFSEHNFLWHDLMLRVETPGAAEFLAADFERSWRQESGSHRAAFDGLELICSTGGGDATMLDAITREIRAAQRSLVFQCPYVTEPYLGLMGEARRRGVEVTILTSERSNRFLLKQSIMEACRQHDLQLRLMPGPMTHVKALLADGETLLLGSANFDFLSATLQPEILAVVRDPELVQDFERRVLAADMAGSRCWRLDETSSAVTGFGAGVINLAGEVLHAVHGNSER